MRRSDVWMLTFAILVAILIVVRMVPAHAEDTSDDTDYPYGTPTETVFIETPYPTMTEMAIPENPTDIVPTATPTLGTSDLPATPEMTPTATPDPNAVDPNALPTLPASIDDPAFTDAPPLADGDAAPVVLEDVPVALESGVPQPATPMICPSTTLLVISGETRPLTMLLLLFDTRIVGGGMSDESGHYDIPLSVGTERPGSHVVQVIARQNGRHIQQVTCETP